MDQWFSHAVEAAPKSHTERLTKSVRMIDDEYVNGQLGEISGISINICFPSFAS